MLTITPRAETSSRPLAGPHWSNAAEIPALTRPSEFCLTLKPEPGEQMEDMFQRLAEALGDATILQILAFGSVSASAATLDAMRKQFGAIDWPVTWMEGAGCNSEPVAGLEIYGIADAEVQRIRIDGRVVGSVYSDGSARHCMVGDLGSRTRAFSRGEQTKQTIEELEDALALAGFSLADTVRTWFYLDDILAWYDEFNRARTEIYSRIKFRTGSLPASTGIGARNSAGTDLALAAWAVQPLDNDAHAKEVGSPLQCPAPAYGSSFSRAMEISSPAGRRLLISGTASIAPGGETSWKDDPRRQVELTMEVVEAILQSRNFSFSDVSRATAYFRRRADAWAFAEWCSKKGHTALPVVVVYCDVCRDDLLFELEADASQSH
jgi:enamine deaminase RidA (YjgF/YER057c/UK114 family)